MTTKNTLLKNISRPQYDAIDAINYSSLKKFMISPMHYKESIDTEQEGKEAFVTGNAVHTFCLQPENFDKRYAVAPVCDRRTKDGKETWQNFIEENANKEHLTFDQNQQVLDIGKAVVNNKLFKTMLQGEHYTECAIVSDYAGATIKGCLDLFNTEKNIIVDIKTFNNPPLVQPVLREIFDRKYHYQAYLYRILAEKINGTKPDFLWCFVEKKKPNTIGWYEYDDRLVSDEAKQLIEDAICRLDNAKLTGIYTGLLNENTPIKL